MTLSIYLSTYHISLSIYLSIYPQHYTSIFLSTQDLTKRTVEELSVCASYYLSIYPQYYPSILLYIYVSIYLGFAKRTGEERPVFLLVSIYPSISLSIYPSVYLISMYLPTQDLPRELERRDPYALSIYISIHSIIHLSFCIFNICPSVYLGLEKRTGEELPVYLLLSFYLSIALSIYPSVYLSIYLPRI